MGAISGPGGVGTTSPVSYTSTQATGNTSTSSATSPNTSSSIQSSATSVKETADVAQDNGGTDAVATKTSATTVVNHSGNAQALGGNIGGVIDTLA